MYRLRNVLFSLMATLWCCLSPYSALSAQIKKSDNIKPPVKLSNNNNNKKKNITEREIINSIAKVITPQSQSTSEKIAIERLHTTGTLHLTDSMPNNQSFEIAVASENKKPVSYGQLEFEGYRAALTGQYESAAFLYKKALSLAPDDIGILYTLGTIYHKLKQLEEAKYYYKCVLETNPEHKKALHNFLAVISEEFPQGALTELSRLKDVNPNYSPVLAQIGMIYAKQEDYEQAEQYLRKAIILSPEESLYKYNLAVMYDRRGQYQAAVKLYQVVLDQSEYSGVLPQSYEAIKQRMTVLAAR